MKRYIALLFFVLMRLLSPSAQTVAEDIIEPPPVLVDSIYDIEENIAPLPLIKDSIRLVKELKLSLSYKDSVVKDPAYWYANYIFENKLEQFENKKEQSPQEKGWEYSPWVRFTLWSFVIAFFLIAVYLFLAQTDFRLFSKKSSKIISGTGGADIITQDIFSIPYETAIPRAKEEHNWRLAIRLYYLQLLKSLNNRNYIHYLPEKTNTNYKDELTRYRFSDEFNQLTQVYELVWYGIFPVNRDRFLLFEQQLTALNNLIEK